MANENDIQKIEALFLRLIKVLTTHEAKIANEYICTKAAATYLGISPELLENWRTYGDGPKFTKLAHAVRYKKSNLDEFMLSRTKANTAEVPRG
ncbi:MAG: DNA-binding protein [Alphaproteobacteria bacterium]|nr:DNA-binding protein [Alphaproteobacteria bacterium]